MSIEVFNESGYDGVNEEMLIDVLSFALGEMDIHPDAEASIHIVDVDTIADLHVKWLDLEGPTDVMSFPMDELTPGYSRPDGATPAPPCWATLCCAQSSRQSKRPKQATT